MDLIWITGSVVVVSTICAILHPRTSWTNGAGWMQNRHRSMLRCCFESDSEVNRSCLTQRKHLDTFRMKIVMASGTGMQRKCRDPKSQDEKSNGEFSCLSYCLNTKCLHQCDNCLSRVMYWCSYSWLYWLIILLQEWLERFGCFLTGTVDSVRNITLNRGSRLSLLAFPPRSLSAFTHQSNERNKKIEKKNHRLLFWHISHTVVVSKQV